MRRLLSSLLIAVAMAGCSGVQKTADAGTTALGEALLPTSEEVKLGNQLAAEVNKEEKILKNDAVQRYVDQVGQKIVNAAGKDRRAGIKYNFTVIDNPNQVNAFALPGGHIYIYSGLIKAADSEAELASVLGHEVGHVTERHAARALGAQFGLQTLASLALGQNPGMISQLAAGIAAQGYMSRHSRDAEREADNEGFAFFTRAGYDPAAMPAFFKKLQRMSGGNPNAFEQFFASHPAPGERAQTLSGKIRTSGKSSGKSELVGGFDQIKAQIGGRSSSTSKPSGSTGTKPSGSTSGSTSGGTQQAPRPR
ncbi:M48 family metallopeptidase [Vulgatibacter sp.]|uniref:M48 family metallopeptidase n=1 Tax=Vulgatibacter sp. TaxID=1971226 RepID=UPI0035625FF5